MDERIARDPAAIRAMFAEVAPRYDLLNHVLSLRQDVRWRRLLVAALEQAPAGRILDLATGTGDVALAIAGRAVTGADFCLDMLALARRKESRPEHGVTWAAADALALPFPARCFAGVVIGFGVRNFADLGAGFGEISRVLVAGGILGVLELHRPERRAAAAVSRLWNRLVVTPVGRLVSHDGSAYAYLPASVDTFPSRTRLAELLRALGWKVLTSRDLSGGIAALTVARWEGGP